MATLAVAIPVLAGTPVTCIVPDNATGTADMPPVGCGYVSLSPLAIVDGLPPGTTIACDATIESFFDITYIAGPPGSGGTQQFSARLGLDMTGSGTLAGYFRPAFFDVFFEISESPSSCCYTFDTYIFFAYGQLAPGDPDFDLLRISSGDFYGLSSPGHTTLTRTATGGWAVDSFFDITYRIDFVGKPGGQLGGMSGSTTGTIRVQCGTSNPVGTESATWGGIKALYY